MAEEVAALAFRIDAQTARFEAGMKRVERQLARTTGIVARQAKTADDRLAAMGERFGISIPARAALVTGAIAGIGLAIAQVVRDGDRIRQLEGRFRDLTGSAEGARAMLAGVFEVASRTGSGLTDTGSLAASFRAATQEIGATDEEVLRFTENLQKLGAIGGASTQEMANGLRQLGQGLAGGVLRAEEFNSVIENALPVAQALADGLAGGSLGALREMVNEGRVFSEDILRVILADTENINRRFDELPDSIERASNRFDTALTGLLARISEILGLSELVAAAWGRAAENLEAFTGAITTTDFEAYAEAVDRLTRLQGERDRFRARSADGPAAFSDLRNQAEAELDAQIAEATAAVQAALARANAGASPQPARTAGGGAGGSGGSGAARAEADAYSTLLASIAASNIERVNELQLVGLTGAARERAALGFEAEAVAQQLWNAAAKDGVAATEELTLEIDLTVENYVRLREALIAAEAAQEAQADASAEAARRAEETRRAIGALSEGIAGAISRANSFAGALKNVALLLAETALQGAFGLGPLGGAFNLLGGGGSGGPLGTAGGGSIFDLFGAGPFAFAKGAAFRGGRVTPFASGGVVHAPTMFPMSGGFGLMGEAGAEAIMPLRRGPGGRLGVEAGGAARPISITMNVTTPDADSFRRSSGQIAAELARALARARRER